MNALTLLAKYATPLSDLTTVVIADRKANKADADKRDERKGGLVDQLRALAVTLHTDGLKASDASDILRFALGMVTDEEGKSAIPGGTIKNYCAAMRGYHKLLTEGKDISDVNTAKAAEEVASEEFKRIKAAKATFAKASKKWSADKWEEFAASFAITATVDGDEEADETESEEVEEEARAAANG